VSRAFAARLLLHHLLLVCHLCLRNSCWFMLPIGCDLLLLLLVQALECLIKLDRSGSASKDGWQHLQ
jgi:hypothetical protein